MSPSSIYFPRIPTSELFELGASLAVIAMAICGLAGIHAPILAAAATIVFGAALMMNGSRLLRSYRGMSYRSDSSPSESSYFEAWSNNLPTAVFVTGFLGATLAVFALFGLFPAFLTPVASVIFSAGLVLKSNVAWQLHLLGVLNAIKNGRRVDQTGFASELIASDSAIYALSGLVAGALGAISAAGDANDLALNLIALLVLASTLTVSSQTTLIVTARLAHAISQSRSRAQG
ncbi:MAG: hypothetical protein ACR650_16230 [Methylocystis sp.]|jgi:hypothetical protein